MEKKLNLFTILAILIVPVLLYTILKSPTELENASIAAQGKPMVIKFTSTLCLECKELEKVLKTVKPKYAGKVVFKTINVNNRSAAVNKEITKYKVNVVPTMVFVNKNGKMVEKTEGCLPKAELERKLDILTHG